MEDRNLITAQGPAGAKNLGNAVVRALEKVPFVCEMVLSNSVLQLQPLQPALGNPYVPRDASVPPASIHA